MESSTSLSIPIIVANREKFETALQDAVDKAIEEALTSHGGGILVTRHEHNAFSVQLSQEVPFGTTQELDLRGATR